MIWRRKRRSSTEKTKHLRGLARVAGYFTCATIVCGVVSIRHARAEYADQTLLFGRQMLNLTNAQNHEVTKITFNGQQVHVGSSVTVDGPEIVLDKFEDYCKKNNGQVDDFTGLDKNTAPAAQPQAASAAPTLSEPTTDKSKSSAAGDVAKVGFQRTAGQNGEGVVVCFVKGPKTKSTTSEAFNSFITTGELGAFGELRYAYASKTPSGKTLVLNVWTDSQFNLREMVGEQGKDVPGEDFAELPRVPNATRILSARADGTPYGLNVYQTSDAPSKTLSFYDGEMRKSGWFTYDPEMTEKEHGGVGRSYMKDGVVVTLGISTQEKGNFVAVGLSGVAADDNKIAKKVGPR